MRVFVSHAVADKELVDPLVKLLRLGCGLPHESIFCSSSAGMGIPNGAFFVQHILQRLRDADVVVALLTPNFVSREFCLAEVGAAQFRQLLHPFSFFSLLVPPAAYSTHLNGVLYGAHSGRINDSRALDELHERTKGSTVAVPVWNDAKEDFLSAVQPIIAAREIRRQIDEGVMLTDVDLERSTSQSVFYKLKLRAAFTNRVGQDVIVTGVRWDSGADGARGPAGRPWSILQPSTATGAWGEETHRLAVGVDAGFRASAALDQMATDRELVSRLALRKLGILRMRVEAAGHSSELEVRL